MNKVLFCFLLNKNKRKEKISPLLRGFLSSSILSEIDGQMAVFDVHIVGL